MANANPALPDLLRTRLRSVPGGRLPWSLVMQMALYEPGLGYYRQGVRRIGRGGDFYTSVSVGPLFGGLLAEFAYEAWRQAGRPDRFTIIEQGAHDGTLARDFLLGCQSISTEFFDALRYHILEPDEALREAQRRTLGADLGSKLCHDTLCEPGPGLFLCNELLDAFPVHRVRWDGAAWQELWVAEDPESPCGFRFVEGELSSDSLKEELPSAPHDLLPGWTTEVCPAVVSWLEDLAKMPFKGPVLILDYGFTAEEHFALEREQGTLRRYHKHRMDDALLEDLGDADLTSHVDFSRVSELAISLGFQVEPLIDQGRFLTRLFIDAFKRHGMAPDAATQRQFHTLSHPGHMGRSFQALVLKKTM